MSNQTKKPAQPEPRGAEGVPVDAPGNTGPAISPQAVSRMHRTEDDAEAIAHSPEFSNEHNVAMDDRVGGEHWTPGAPGSGHATDASKGLDTPAPNREDPNPSHDTSKDPSTPPRGLEDGELMEQPKTPDEAHKSGADPRLTHD